MFALAFFLHLCLSLTYALKTEPVLWRDNKTLTCFNESMGYEFQHWIVATEEIVTESVEGEYEVNKENGALTIWAASGEDTGVYRCVYRLRDGSYGMSTQKIDVWDYSEVIRQALDWETNLIRGIILAAISIGISVGYWLLYEWQWVPPADFGTAAIYEKHGIKAHEIELTDMPVVYDNHAFLADMMETKFDSRKDSVHSESSSETEQTHKRSLSHRSTNGEIKNIE